MNDDINTAFLLSEWDQAWAHSRHLENLRAQYLGFFFAAVLGVTAIAAKGVADDHFATSGSIVTVAALGLGLEGLVAFVYRAVVRINVVLDHYLEEICAIRDGVAEIAAARVDLRAFRRPPGTFLDDRRTRDTVLHGTESALSAATVLFPAVLLGCVVRAATATGVGASTVAVCAAVFVLGVGLWRGAQRPELDSNQRPSP
jgi:hypothetical protein